MAGIVVCHPEEWSTAHPVLHINLSRCLTKKRSRSPQSQSLDFFSEEFTSSVFSFSCLLFIPPSFPFFLLSDIRYIQLYDYIFPCSKNDIVGFPLNTSPVQHIFAMHLLYIRHYSKHKGITDEKDESPASEEIQ